MKSSKNASSPPPQRSQTMSASLSSSLSSYPSNPSSASSSSSSSASSSSSSPRMVISMPYNVHRVAWMGLDLRWSGDNILAQFGVIDRDHLVRLGGGGMANVYLIKHAVTRTQFALKVFHRHHHIVTHEIEIMRHLHHPNCIQYFGCIQRGEELFLIQEYAAGGSLLDLLRRSSEKLRETHIAYILKRVLLALQYLHSLSILHRDVKSANILLTATGEVKLTDFGISEFVGGAGNGNGHTGSISSTSHSMMSPSHAQAISISPTRASSMIVTSPTSIAAASAAIGASIAASRRHGALGHASPSSSQSPSTSSSASSSHSASPCDTNPSHPLAHHPIPSPPLSPTFGGSPLWMPVEALRGLPPSALTDVYALGITAIELAEGHPPYHTCRSLAEVCAAVKAGPVPSLAAHATSYINPSAKFAHFVEVCTCADPDMRWGIDRLLQHPFVCEPEPEGKPSGMRSFLLRGAQLISTSFGSNSNSRTNSQSFTTGSSAAASFSQPASPARFAGAAAGTPRLTPRLSADGAHMPHAMSPPQSTTSASSASASASAALGMASPSTTHGQHVGSPHSHSSATAAALGSSVQRRHSLTPTSTPLASASASASASIVSPSASNALPAAAPVVEGKKKSRLGMFFGSLGIKKKTKNPDKVQDKDKSTGTANIKSADSTPHISPSSSSTNLLALAAADADAASAAAHPMHHPPLGSTGYGYAGSTGSNLSSPTSSFRTSASSDSPRLSLSSLSSPPIDVPDESFVTFLRLGSYSKSKRGKKTNSATMPASITSPSRAAQPGPAPTAKPAQMITPPARTATPPITAASAKAVTSPIVSPAQQYRASPKKIAPSSSLATSNSKLSIATEEPTSPKLVPAAEALPVSLPIVVTPPSATHLRSHHMHHHRHHSSVAASAIDIMCHEALFASAVARQHTKLPKLVPRLSLQRTASLSTVAALEQATTAGVVSGSDAGGMNMSPQRKLTRVNSQMPYQYRMTDGIEEEDEADVDNNNMISVAAHDQLASPARISLRKQSSVPLDSPPMLAASKSFSTSNLMNLDERTDFDPAASPQQLHTPRNRPYHHRHRSSTYMPTDSLRRRLSIPLSSRKSSMSSNPDDEMLSPRGAAGGVGDYTPRGGVGDYTPRGGPGEYTPRGGPGDYTPRGVAGDFTPRRENAASPYASPSPFSQRMSDAGDNSDSPTSPAMVAPKMHFRLKLLRSDSMVEADVQLAYMRQQHDCAPAEIDPEEEEYIQQARRSTAGGGGGGWNEKRGRGGGGNMWNINDITSEESVGAEEDNDPFSDVRGNRLNRSSSLIQGDAGTNGMDMAASYIISSQGTLVAGNFSISAAGLQTSNENGTMTRRGSVKTVEATKRVLSSVGAGDEDAMHTIDEDHNRTLDRPPSRVTSLSDSTASSPTHRDHALSKSDLFTLGIIGKGQNGSVLKAIHLPSLTRVALKSIYAHDRGTRHQLLHELTAYAHFDSPYLVAFLGAYYEDGVIVLATEYMSHGSLLSFISHRGCLRSMPRVFKQIAYQCIAGLFHMHDGCSLHRDLKPDNVLLDHDGRCVIADFGLLKDLESTNAMSNTFLGTLSYLSPERILSQEYSYPADVWSMGLTLMYALTGIPPIVCADFFTMLDQISRHPPPLLSVDTHPDIDADCCDFINSMLKMAPADRLTCTQLLSHPFLLGLEGDPSVVIPQTHLLNDPDCAVWSVNESNAADLDMILELIISHHMITDPEASSSAAALSIVSPRYPSITPKAASILTSAIASTNKKMTTSATPHTIATTSDDVFTTSLHDISNNQSAIIDDCATTIPMSEIVDADSIVLSIVSTHTSAVVLAPSSSLPLLPPPVLPSFVSQRIAECEALIARPSRSRHGSDSITSTGDHDKSDTPSHLAPLNTSTLTPLSQASSVSPNQSMAMTPYRLTDKDFDLFTSPRVNNLPSPLSPIVSSSPLVSSANKTSGVFHLSLDIATPPLSRTKSPLGPSFNFGIDDAAHAQSHIVHAQTPTIREGDESRQRDGQVQSSKDRSQQEWSNSGRDDERTIMEDVEEEDSTRADTDTATTDTKPVFTSPSSLLLSALPSTLFPASPLSSPLSSSASFSPPSSASSAAAAVLPLSPAPQLTLSLDADRCECLARQFGVSMETVVERWEEKQREMMKTSARKRSQEEAHEV